MLELDYSGDFSGNIKAAISSQLVKRFLRSENEWRWLLNGRFVIYIPITIWTTPWLAGKLSYLRWVRVLCVWHQKFFVRDKRSKSISVCEKEKNWRIRGERRFRCRSKHEIEMECINRSFYYTFCNSRRNGQSRLNIILFFSLLFVI